MTITWCIVPGIWTTTDRIFVIVDKFLPLYPQMDPENQNFGKMNNTPEDIIILQMCAINDSHKIYGSWDMKCNRQNFLPFWTMFCPFNPWKPEKKFFLKNRSKNTWRYYHFTHVYHKILRFPEIWSVTDRIFCHFGPFFVFFYYPNNPKNQSFEKRKQTSGNIIILHMCIINDNHMMYGSSDMKRDRQNFLLFWTLFCHFTSETTQKIKILKNWRKHLTILSFYTCVP